MSDYHTKTFEHFELLAQHEKLKMDESLNDSSKNELNDTDEFLQQIAQILVEGNFKNDEAKSESRTKSRHRSHVHSYEEEEDHHKRKHDFEIYKEEAWKRSRKDHEAYRTVGKVSWRENKDYEEYKEDPWKQKNLNEYKEDPWKQKNLNNYKEEWKQNYDDDDFNPEEFYCKCCNLAFSGEIPYEQHLAGKRHRKKLDFYTKEKYADDSDESPDERTVMNCNLCKVQVTGKQQMKQHIAGKLHKKAEERIMEGVNHYYCDVCALSFTGYAPYDSHMKGKRHQYNAEAYS